MKITLTLIFTTIVATSFATAQEGNAFSLPKIDGYKNYAFHLKHQTLSPPIIKQLKVLKPLREQRDRSSLQSEFKEFFTSLGWQKKSETDGYLEFGFELYEWGDQYGNTHKAGNCEVWISETGDLITLYQYQWRISHFHPETTRRLNRIKQKMESASKEIGFTIVETRISDWPDFYSNENLVEYQAYSLQLPEDLPKVHDSEHTKGSAQIRLLGYRTDNHAISAMDSGRLSRSEKNIRSRNIVVMFETRDESLLPLIESFSEKMELDSITGETQREWEKKMQNNSGGENSE